VTQEAQKKKSSAFSHQTRNKMKMVGNDTKTRRDFLESRKESHDSETGRLTVRNAPILRGQAGKGRYARSSVRPDSRETSNPNERKALPSRGRGKKKKRKPAENGLRPIKGEGTGSGIDKFRRRRSRGRKVKKTC